MLSCTEWITPFFKCLLTKHALLKGQADVKTKQLLVHEQWMIMEPEMIGRFLGLNKSLLTETDISALVQELNNVTTSQTGTPWEEDWTYDEKWMKGYPNVQYSPAFLHSTHLYQVHDTHRTGITAFHRKLLRQLLGFDSWSANMSEKLKGNILVTGTNRGIGLELVKQLAEKTGEDSYIYACCREPEGTRAEVRHTQQYLT